MNKRQFRLMRMGYRYCRRHDASWRPDPYRSTQQPQVRPDTAGAFLKGLPERLREAVQARPLPGPAPVQRGPRARWYAGWRPDRGEGYAMTLHQRVAFRRAMRKVRLREIERMINPVAVQQMMSSEMLRLATERMNAVGFKLSAMEAMRKYEHARLHGLPY